MNKHPITLLTAAGALSAVLPTADAAISLDRTRAVYVSDAKSISLNIVNENKELPFPAQSGWRTSSTRKSPRRWWCCRRCSAWSRANAA